MIIKAIPQAVPAEKEASPVSNANDFRVYPTPLSTPLQTSLFEIAPDSDFANLLDFACQLANFDPTLLDAIVADLDAKAEKNKQNRQEHKRWLAEQTESLIDVPANEVPEPKLEVGRPRMAPLCVLVFLLLRGWLGGCKDQRFRGAVQESISLRIFLENMGTPLPAASTISENLNAISIETLENIFLAELALAMDEELDDFAMLRVDSTDVSSASLWDTDGR